jgi:energy-coupling factor transporter transmembrane protein EcfT
VDTFELSYRDTDSVLHRMDPFAKTLYIVAVSLIAIFNGNLWVGLALFLFTLFVAAFWSGVSLRAYWQLGKVILPFILILALVFPFFYSGQVTAGSSEIAIRTPIKDLTWGALGFGALLALRFLAIGISGLTFAFTTHPTDMVQNFSRRGMDYRLVHAPVLGLVLFPTFVQLGRDISTTQRIRDLGQDLNWLQRKWERMRHLAFAMLVLGLRNGQTQAMALDIRGYGAHKTRTFMRPLQSSTFGRFFGWACLAVGISYLALQIANLSGAMPWDLAG